VDRPRRPDAPEVARRILVVSTVLARVRAECERPGIDTKAGVADWLRAHDLHESASLRELKFLNAPAGRTDRAELIQLSWRVEACAMLVWSAGGLPQLPAWDALAEPMAVIEALAQAHAEPRTFVAGVRLRPDPEIEDARDQAELWHWRSRAKDDAGIRAAARGVAGAIDGDFPAMGRAYRTLSGEEVATLRSIARERCFALNWLCGFAPGAEWESTPT